MHFYAKGKGAFMLIKIQNDVHDISKRLKEIDESYFVVFNTATNHFEVHSTKQKQTFCLNVPYAVLDKRTIDLTLKTRRENFDKILAEIDKQNEELDKQNQKQIKNLVEFKAKEMFDYAKKHDATNFNDAYVTKWA